MVDCMELSRSLSLCKLGKLIPAPGTLHFHLLLNFLPTFSSGLQKYVYTRCYNGKISHN